MIQILQLQMLLFLRNVAQEALKALKALDFCLWSLCADTHSLRTSPPKTFKYSQAWMGA